LGGLNSQGKEFYKAASELLLCKEKYFYPFLQDFFVPPEYINFSVVCRIYSERRKGFIQLNICAQYKNEHS
jgi:hypothetical protein